MEKIIQSCRRFITGIFDAIVRIITRYYKCLSLFLDFEGRASRLDFWNFFLLNSLIFILILIFSTENPDAGCCFIIVMSFPTWAVIFRRLHDSETSGIWFFLASLIPMLLFLWIYLILYEEQDMPFLERFSELGLSLAMFFTYGAHIAMPLVVYMLFWGMWGFSGMCCKGNPGANKYGDAPQ